MHINVSLVILYVCVINLVPSYEKKKGIDVPN